MTDDTKPKRPWTAEDDAKLVELRAGGRTDLECARMLNRTPQAVQSHRQWLARRARKADLTLLQQVAQEPEQEPARDEDDRPTVFANRKPWTPSEDDQLAELRRVGHDDHSIAVLLGRTTAAVQVRISSLRARGSGASIPTRKRPSRWTPERVGQARALRAEGLTLHQIGRRLGSDAATVSRAIRSPETTEAGPGEGIRVARTVPDLGRAEAEVEQARAVLARAEARHREALEPILAAMREAVRKAGLVQDPAKEGDGVEDEPAWRVVHHLHRHGIDLRVRT